MSRMKNPGLLSAFIVASLAIYGCKEHAPATQTDAATSAEVSVTVNDSGFQPSVWTVPVGQDVTVSVKNTGSKPHAWTVLANRVATQDDLLHYIDQNGAVLARSGEVEPGSNRSVTFRIGEPGSYQVVCIQPGHFAIESQGTLDVK